MAIPFLSKRSGENEMTFVDHLEELRWHIMRSLLAILVAGIAIFINIDWIFDHVIMGPVRNDFVSYRYLCGLSHSLHLGDALCMPPIPANYKLLGNTVSGPFMSAIQIGIVGGFIAELKYSRGAIFWVSLCFFLGGAFGYFVLGPFTFNFLANFTLGKDQYYEYKPALGDYIDNLVNIVLGCGLAFELPILSYVLTRIGIITPRFLSTYRKYAYVAILVLAAVITPSPDWTSQMIVFLPLCLLYELSVIVSKRVSKKDEDMHDWR
jgi:sec-independent protein translocase protein TatC